MPSPSLDAEEILRRARARWPGLSVEPGSLRERLGGEKPPSHGEDLCLALACAARDGVAIRAFEQELLPKAVRVAARMLAPPHTSDDLAQALRERLLQPVPPRAARIGDYNGSVALLSWVRVIARNCALNLRDTQHRAHEEIGEHAAHLIQAGTPELTLLRDGLRDRFRAAFDEAVKRLGARERAVLRLHLAEGVTLEKLASAYGVHRSSVARWVATARAAVLEGTRQFLARDTGASQAEIDSLLRAARSHLEVSISSAFHSGQVGTGTHKPQA